MSRKEWPQQLIFPIIINITTAVLLFLLASAFENQVRTLFDAIFARSAPVVSGYPIACVAEPYQGDPQKRSLKTDFFIINKSGDAFDSLALDALLAAGNPDKQRPLSSRIVLKVKPPASVVVLEEDQMFNDEKGRLLVSWDDEKRTIEITIARIEPRAILKVSFLFSNLHFVSASLDRTSRTAVPIDDDYLKACYSR